MHPSIEQTKLQINDLCRQYGVVRLDVFGSAARGRDFDCDRSDADFLVQFAPTALDNTTYLNFKEALEALLGRSVDLVERSALELSRNTIRRRAILSEAQPLYG
jgi:predicted nucleotidyltransferase